MGKTKAKRPRQSASKAKPPKVNPGQYAYRVEWSEEDGEYVGLCTEFPSLSWLAESQTEALQGITKVVAEVAKDLAESGEPIPEPLSLQKYSGKFVVRVSPNLHRKLKLRAAMEGQSLNALANELLSRDA